VKQPWKSTAIADDDIRTIAATVDIINLLIGPGSLLRGWLRRGRPESSFGFE
jgi:hypothetical protein